MVATLLVAPVLAVAVVLLVAGNGSSAGAEYAAPGEHGRTAGHVGSDAWADQPETSSTSVKPAKPMTVQQLGASIGCTPEPAGNKAADFRQATCTLDGSSLVLLDYDTVKGQQDWLELSKRYGGVYLVGERWTLSSNSRESIQSLAETLGGVVEIGDVHG